MISFLLTNKNLSVKKNFLEEGESFPQGVGGIRLQKIPQMEIE